MGPGRVVQTVSCHAAGDVGDVIVGGVDPPPGDSVWEQSRWIAEDGDISFCQLAWPLDLVDGDATMRSTTVLDPGKLDRSPTGTGVPARMAVLVAQGRLAIGERLLMRSIIGSTFIGTVSATTTVGDRPAIVPTVSGTAWITGTYQHTLDPGDPWPFGYRLSDTWPNAV